jgi:hypothetical protein
MLLAELVVRHTRRHMPTRRVALGSSYLPMRANGLGPRVAPGGLLAAAVTREFAGALNSEDRVDLESLIQSAAGGLDVPRIAVRHRLQRDTHGLDRSRHRIEVDRERRVMIELDTHGNPLPNLLGTVLAFASLPPAARHPGLLAMRNALRGHDPTAGIPIRRLVYGIPYEVPWAPGAAHRRGAPAAELAWIGVPSEQRWAMEVLGMRAAVLLDRDDINRRFRRLVRDAHPDTGSRRAGAAERISELSDARELLLDLVVDDASAAPAGQG